MLDAKTDHPDDGNRQVDQPNANRGCTLASFRIENYRVLRDLSVGNLGRINLFGGPNNSGKTSLLEALFLLSGGDPTTQLFSSLDTATTTKITGVHRSLGDLILRVDRKQGIQFEQTNARPHFIAISLAPQFANARDDADRLSRLRERKQGELVAEALQIVDPRLRHIEVRSASGVPLIWGDIGLPEFVPLALMGEGMNRVARIMLAICDAPGGIVLVDEIETGLHHSVLPGVWRAVDEAARRCDTQIAATTHSYECVQSAVEVLGSRSGFFFHRLEANNSRNRCVTYQPETLDGAIRRGFEIR